MNKFSTFFPSRCGRIMSVKFQHLVFVPHLAD
jgi:hypothetical protein